MSIYGTYGCYVNDAASKWRAIYVGRGGLSLPTNEFFLSQNDTGASLFSSNEVVKDTPTEALEPRSVLPP